jgi:hypothetical protein
MWLFEKIGLFDCACRIMIEMEDRLLLFICRVVHNPGGGDLYLTRQ